MKVRDLIEALKEQDQDASVFILSPDEFAWSMNEEHVDSIEAYDEKVFIRA